MSEEIFSKVLSDLLKIYPLPDVLFGGYGEPLSHPKILEMIRRLSEAGCQVALITNGTLLTTNLISALKNSGLGKLWISADNFHQQAINSNPPGPIHPGTLAQIAELNRSGNGRLLELNPGLAMLLVKNNHAELLNSLSQAVKLGIKSFHITNLEAYSPSQTEVLNYSLGQLRRPGGWRTSNLDLIETMLKITATDKEISIEGAITSDQDKCPFAEKGELVVRFDGDVSPCLPLLYSRTTFIGNWEHEQHAYSLGNIQDRSLAGIWNDRGYIQLRERLLEDEFSPCLGCRDCWLSDDNLQDCMGFEHPTCGGCLWAAGMISCP